MKEVVLFTSEFPYGNQETFLENEMQHLSEEFDKVVIIPLFKHLEAREIPFSNIEVATPINNSRKVSLHKISLVVSLTFWHKLLHGVLKCGIHPKCLLKALKQASIVARVKKYLLKRPQFFDTNLWYFYWGTNSVNVLPFLDKHPKTLARFHRYDLYGTEIPGGEIQLFQKHAIKRLDRAICISDDGFNYLVKKYPQYKEKFDVSRLGVPNRGECLPSKDNILRVVSCSNLYKVKRVHLLAQALQEITDFHIEWTHIGDGPQEFKNLLFNEVDKLPKNIKFTFKGRMANSETMRFYQSNSVDLFVNTSISEGAPVSIMEALSFGIPVIATDAGGTKELVGSGEQFLCPLDITAQSLAIKIVNFAKLENKNSYRLSAKQKALEIANSDNNYKDFCKKMSSLSHDEGSSIYHGYNRIYI